MSLLYSAFPKLRINLLSAATESLCSSPLFAFLIFLWGSQLEIHEYLWSFMACVCVCVCNNLGSVPSRQQHKEPTAKDKASLNSKASFLFRLLKKNKTKQSPKHLISRELQTGGCPHASSESSKAHHTYGPGCEGLQGMNTSTLLSKERVRGTNPRAKHTHARTPWSSSHYRK